VKKIKIATYFLLIFFLLLIFFALSLEKVHSQSIDPYKNNSGYSNSYNNNNSYSNSGNNNSYNSNSENNNSYNSNFENSNFNNSNSENSANESGVRSIRLKLASSDPNYLVTTGDAYILTYFGNEVVMTQLINIDNTYKVNISNLGAINAAGMTFYAFKEQVEKLVKRNFPFGSPQLVFSDPALFKVNVNGEVDTTKSVNAWALTRISDLVDNIGMTLYASKRNFIVTSKNGTKKQYDLFKWERDGDEKQNPYLRPGDTITVQRKVRRVQIAGEVERPGVYELLDGENLDALIKVYGGGYTILADKSKAEIQRVQDKADMPVLKVFLTSRDLTNDYELNDYDSVFIPNLTEIPSVFYLEGAVSANRVGETQIITKEENVSTRFAVPFIEGDTYNSLIRRNVNWFSDVSDLAKSYIKRGDDQILLDINRILYDSGYTVETKIEKGDDLMVPFKQYFVTVDGAVYLPGRYPFIPDRTWEYYVGLAGGLITEKNSNESVQIVTSDKVKLKKSDFIQPETSILANSNSFLYYFNQYAPIVTTVLTIATTALSIWAITGR